jgi:hypothetical protein
MPREGRLGKLTTSRPLNKEENKAKMKEDVRQDLVEMIPSLQYKVVNNFHW